MDTWGLCPDLLASQGAGLGLSALPSLTSPISAPCQGDGAGTVEFKQIPANARTAPAALETCHSPPPPPACNPTLEEPDPYCGHRPGLRPGGSWEQQSGSEDTGNRTGRCSRHRGLTTSLLFLPALGALLTSCPLLSPRLLPVRSRARTTRVVSLLRPWEVFMQRFTLRTGELRILHLFL